MPYAMILDCETPESTLRSLASILSTQETDLNVAIANLGEVSFPINTDMTKDRHIPMLEFVMEREADDYPEGTTCYFHATRVFDFDCFRKGIFPLEHQMNAIWETLYPLVKHQLTESQWREFRKHVEADNYDMAKDTFRCWKLAKGPCAFMIAEIPLNPEVNGSNDYFACSELLEFIDRCFVKRFNWRLRDRLLSNARPAMVKFKKRGIKAGDLGAALDYLVRKHLGASLSNVDPSFVGKGQAISPQDVLAVIPIVEHRTTYRSHPKYSISPKEQHQFLNPDDLP